MKGNTVKLSKRTIDVFKYLSTISPSILIREGNVLRSRNAARTVLSRVEIDEEFPKEFLIYDIPSFLRVVNLFDSPDIEFFDTHMIISQDTAKIRYMYSAKELYPNPPGNEDYTPSNIDWSMNVFLEESNIENYLKAANVMNLDTISFTEAGIILFNSNDEDSNNFEVEYQNAIALEGDTPDTYSINFKTANFNVFEGDYSANFFCGAQVGVALTSPDDKVKVWLSSLPSSQV